ncbi:hypothetical protein [Chryseobacterium sp. MMS23-Vi53]|uniref:hypothetical protein n=1 Tax=Chryseobacterium sp. MMS23-Vi53 TaxID=3386644 RepID=UPI0039EB17E2
MEKPMNIYTNTNWEPIDGGRLDIAQNAFNRKYYDWLKLGGEILTDSGDNSVDIYHTGRMGIGISSPQAFLDVAGIVSGTDATTTIRARNIPVTDTSVLINNQTLSPLYISAAGFIVKGISPAVFPNSYSFNRSIAANSGATSGAIFSGITGSTIVTFKFVTNFSFGNSNTGILYGNISYSNKRGFQIDSDWSYSGNTSTSAVNIVGVGTDSLVFDFVTGPDLTFSYAGGIIRATKATGGTNTNIFIYEGTKMR